MGTGRYTSIFIPKSTWSRGKCHVIKKPFISVAITTVMLWYSWNCRKFWPYNATCVSHCDTARSHMMGYHVTYAFNFGTPSLWYTNWSKIITVAIFDQFVSSSRKESLDPVWQVMWQKGRHHARRHLKVLIGPELLLAKTIFLWFVNMHSTNMRLHNNNVIVT